MSNSPSEQVPGLSASASGTPEGSRASCPPSPLANILASVRQALQCTDARIPEISPRLADSIVNDYREIEIEAVRKQVLPADFLRPDCNRAAYFSNCFLLFDRMMREKYPTVLVDPDEDKNHECRLYLLRQCGVVPEKK